MQEIFQFIYELFSALEMQPDLREYAVFACCVAVVIIGFTTFCVAIVAVFRAILGVLQ